MCGGGYVARMKTKLSLLFAAVAFALVPAIHAADQKPADKKDPSAPCCEHCKDACKCEAGKCTCDEKKPEKKMVMLTGSRLPQEVTRVGRITDSMHPVTVLSREDLDSTGEADLARALRKLVPQMH